jgi:hypothetical protein
MPSRLPEPQATPRSGPASPRAADELTRVLFAQGGLVWLGGRSILFLILLLGWLVVR